MKLLTQEIAAKLPKLYSTDKVALADKKVVVKFFQPWGRWTWYAVEGEQMPDGDWKFFGLVDGFEQEWGYWLLSELESIKGPFGLTIERDIHFGTQKISDIHGVTV